MAVRFAGSNSISNIYRYHVKVDETCVGRRQSDMSNRWRERLLDGGAFRMMPVAGTRDRSTGQVSAELVPGTMYTTLHGLGEGRIHEDATV